jgi:hypothetical protein
LENRLPEPGSLDDALVPPLAAVWVETVAMLRDFMSQPAAGGAELIQALAGRLGGPAF